MLLTRLSRPQFLSPAWTARWDINQKRNLGTKHVSFRRPFGGQLVDTANPPQESTSTTNPDASSPQLLHSIPSWQANPLPDDEIHTTGKSGGVRPTKSPNFGSSSHAEPTGRDEHDGETEHDAPNELQVRLVRWDNRDRNPGNRIWTPGLGFKRPLTSKLDIAASPQGPQKQQNEVSPTLEAPSPLILNSRMRSTGMAGLQKPALDTLPDGGSSELNTSDMPPTQGESSSQPEESRTLMQPTRPFPKPKFGPASHSTVDDYSSRTASSKFEKLEVRQAQLPSLAEPPKAASTFASEEFQSLSPEEPSVMSIDYTAVASPKGEESQVFPERESSTLLGASILPRTKSRSNRKSSPAKRTLLEELFPDEHNNARKVNHANKSGGSPFGVKREFEWARGRAWRSPATRDVFSDSKDIPEAGAPKIRRIDELEIRQRRNASVLVLQNASKSLSESDFMRLSAKGDHIEGWTSGIIKVIPGRHPVTLEPLGHYMILFSTDAAARAYQDHVRRLHHLSRTYTSRSISSPLPPPPGYLKDGEDINALMQGFTLIPASQQSVSIRMLKKPFSRVVQSTIINGGHPALAARHRVCPDLVLFSLDRGSVSIYDLHGVIGSDGRERNHHWQLFGSENDIIRLDTLVEDDGAAEEVGGVNPTRVQGGPLPPRKKKRLAPRFIISFKDQLEARRFVRAWHQRPFPERGDWSAEDEVLPMVSAQLLW